MEALTDAAAPAAASDAVVSSPDVSAEAAAGERVLPAEKPSLDADLRAVWNKNHPDRWAEGRFTPREPDARASRDASGKPAEVSADGETTGQADPLRRDQAASSVAAPLSWTADMKAKWETLPPDVQTYVARRDKESHEAITRAGQYVKSLGQVVEAYEPLGQVITAYQDDFARRGMPPAQGIAVLLDAQRRLDADPVGGLVQIGLMYGIDLRQALQGQGANPQGGQPAPAAQASPWDNEALRPVLDQVGLHQRWIAAQEQAREEAIGTELQHTIADFADGKQFFDEARPLMAALLRGGQANDLAEAYDMAVNAKPDIRRRIQADQRRTEQDKRTMDARSKADQARRAASVNVRSVPIGANPKTMDDTLTEIARRRYA
jgi:hypothetical protein